MARRGEITLDDVPMREVDITDIRVLNWAVGDYPELDVAIACGSGTCIRSIARDLGEKLGCGATLSGLRRTYSNGFDLNSSLSFEQIAELLRSGNFEVLAPDHGLHFLPMLFLDENATKRWCMGQVIAIKDVLSEGENILSQFVRMCDRNQNFLGVSAVIESGLQPIVVLNPIN